MRLLARVQTGRVSAWLCLVVALLATGALFATLPKSTSDAFPTAGLPETTQSAQVAALLETFPNADQTVALMVWTRPEGSDRAVLTVADQEAVATKVEALSGLSVTPQAVRPQLSSDGTVLLAVVPLVADDDSAATVEMADRFRTLANQDLPDGMTAQLTGPLGFQADTSTAFAGADVRLLIITAVIVAVLLIVTYRSPVLWLVPLTVVATADGLARVVVDAVAVTFDVPVDASILGILSVLVFGAGTNYALLLIARYRDELRAEPDRRRAMRIAYAGAGPAILASGGTVVVSLLVLSFAELGGTRALGLACAIGIALALAFALLVLPAALVVCGRGLFWPFVPRVEQGPRRAVERLSIWARIGTAVARRPTRVVIGALLIVGVMSLGLVGAKIGLSQTDQLLGDPESVRAEQVVGDAFSAGLTAQTTVLVPDAAVAEATSVAEGVAGVDSVRRGDSASGYTQLSLTLADAPQSSANLQTVADLRAAYGASEGPAAGSLVGGSDATALDERTAADRDRTVLIPVILGVVLVILTVLLRSLVAPLLLIMSVVATYFASLGAGNFLFQHVFGFAAFDTSVVLFAFLFLVALGIDYNIFLTTRAREERGAYGAREGMQRALTSTGGVITSAGVLLAAVFVVLGVLPVVALAQIGTIVCIGVLLDTMIVRTLLVPALVFLTGERFWWPVRDRTGHSRDGQWIDLPGPPHRWSRLLWRSVTEPPVPICRGGSVVGGDDWPVGTGLGRAV